MGTATTTFTLTVTSPAGSYIAQLKSDPSFLPNTFSTDFSAAAGLNVLAGYNGTLPGEVGYPATGRQKPFNAPDGYTLLDWTGKSHFDSVNNEWWYNAGATGAQVGDQTMIRYNVAENKFRHWQGASLDDPATSVFQSYGSAHNFEGADLLGRKIYRNLSWAGRIGVWDIDTKIGTTLAGDPGNGTDNGTFAATAAFHEANALCVFLTSSTLYRHSMTTGARIPPDWSKPVTIKKPALCYLGGKVYFTGDANAFYRLNADGTTTPMASSPTEMSAEGNNGPTHTILCPLNGYIYAFKLSFGVTGRGVYRFDPNSGATGAWSSNLTTSFPAMRTSPADSIQKWTVGPIASEGVVLLVTSPSDDGTCACHIWKP